MSVEWKYQLRVELPEELMQIDRRNFDNQVLQPLEDVLKRHSARLQNQHDGLECLLAGLCTS